MAKNIVQMHAEIDTKIDFINNARHESRAYDKAINEAIIQIVNDRYDNIKQPKGYSVESVQRVRDELYTIVVLSSPITPSSDIAAYPNDYRHLLSLSALINGTEREVVPATYDELKQINENIFTMPNNKYPVCTQTATGYKIYYGQGNTLGNVFMVYLKHPAVVSRGLPSQEISAGSGVLANGVSYIVVEDGTVHNSVTYFKGQTFTSANTDLASGAVVLRSNTVDCDLPDVLHQEVVNKAAAIMEGWVDEFDSKQSLEFDANKS